MPGRLPDPSPGTTARLREAAEQLRNAQGGTPDDGISGSTDYESWTLARLRRRATELDVENRSAMDKSELIAALRALLPELGDTGEPDDAAGPDDAASSE